MLESVYFITVTMTTCGFGYFHPSSDDSKIFTIFFIFFGLIIVLTVINGIVNSVLFDAQEGVIRFVHGFRNGREDSFLSDSSLRFYKVTFSFGAILLMLLIGTLFYSGNEDWSTTDAAYWTVCTMTTVGYGDLIIKYDSSRVFAIFFILSCVLIYTTAVGNLIEVYIETVTAKAAIVNRLCCTVEGSFSSASRNQFQIKCEEFEGKFSDTWVDELLPEGSVNVTAISREKAILMALVELGILDSFKDIQPLNQVSEMMTSICCSKVLYMMQSGSRDYGGLLSTDQCIIIPENKSRQHADHIIDCTCIPGYPSMCVTANLW